MGLIQGHKTWRIAPRNSTPLLHPVAGRRHQFHGDLFAPDLDRHPANALANGWHAEQYPGDVIFIPSGCAHQVFNRPADEDDQSSNISVAVAHNFVDRPIAGLFLSALEQLAMAAIGRESRFYGDLSEAFADIGDIARPNTTRPK